MLVTVLGMVMEVRAEHPLNALPPILVTELGMVMEVREEQYSNAAYPMLVTELGMVMEVREEHLLNALSPIHLVPALIVYVLSDLSTASTKYVSA